MRDRNKRTKKGREREENHQPLKEES